jgi:hypothetical protein
VGTGARRRLDPWPHPRAFPTGSRHSRISPGVPGPQGVRSSAFHRVPRALLAPSPGLSLPPTPFQREVILPPVRGEQNVPTDSVGRPSSDSRWRDSGAPGPAIIALVLYGTIIQSACTVVQQGGTKSRGRLPSQQLTLAISRTPSGGGAWGGVVTRTFSPKWRAPELHNAAYEIAGAMAVW